MVTLIGGYNIRILCLTSAFLGCSLLLPNLAHSEDKRSVSSAVGSLPVASVDLNSAATPVHTPSVFSWTSEDFLPVLSDIHEASHLLLILEERRVYVYKEETVLASYPVAIGADETPTPAGEFEIFETVVNPVWQSPWTGEIYLPGPDSALGLRWIGFAEVSNGVIGFHGTPTVSSIGQSASNGCVRLSNEDILSLFRYAWIGMPVFVE